MEVPERGIRRLDWFIRRDLAAKRMKFTDLADRSGLNRTTFYKAVRNDSTMNGESLLQLDKGIGWPAGTCADVIDGGSPPQAETYRTAHARVDSRLSNMERQLDDIWGVLKRLDPALHQQVITNAR